MNRFKRKNILFFVSEGGEVMMRMGIGFIIVILVILLVSCSRGASVHKAEHPAELIHPEGTDRILVKLTEKAVERIALEVDSVRVESVSRYESSKKVVPYSSLIYTPDGKTWIYINPEERIFERTEVVVDYIEGDRVILKDGPEAGTAVASVGVAELYGTEFEVGH